MLRLDDCGDVCQVPIDPQSPSAVPPEQEEEAEAQDDISFELTKRARENRMGNLGGAVDFVAVERKEQRDASRAPEQRVERIPGAQAFEIVLGIVRGSAIGR
eukprot:1190928-Prymnesium_polylepis.1